MSDSRPPAARILLIEDQHDIAASIWDFLERRGYAMDHCADGASGLARALRGEADVIVLDLGLPRLDGLALCRRLRDAGHGVPVLMLTARDTLDDKLRGFAEGADDYLVKPFAMPELEARIRALRRRAQPLPEALPAFAGLSYDPRSLTAQREGRRIPLTRLQGALLQALLREAPRIVSHAALIESAWRGGADVAALQTQVYELRNAIDKPFARPLLHAVRGVGYRLAELE
ncbi:response regulator transcription factor [Thermomonas haemolytica]|uniref:DNA-binding response OmpR family regulator n=1 Tax=Thermomonas haemolytica TaxID=141949 RepID=A0A4R3N7B1_9GAMM|nr:response regulator transcription factor [Thermomonas haemolytica]TCT25181.1 DNA-binding response OmpR family regulator [Thermomonas haemolytica]TNY30317.1 DNA-binding response regulator [Thermomonas haemolytica]